MAFDVFHRLFVVEVPVLFRSFWDEPAEANRHWFQLPPFRLIVSGQAMVRLFFVLSGFTLSISFRCTREQKRRPLRSAVWSAFLRRTLRLYIPLFIWSLVSHGTTVGTYWSRFVLMFVHSRPYGPIYDATWYSALILSTSCIAERSLG